MKTVLIILFALSVLVTSADFAATPAPKDSTDEFNGRMDIYPKQLVKPGLAQIVLNVSIPKGFHSTKDAPITFEWKAADRKVLTFTKDASKYDFTNATFPIQIPLKAIKGATIVQIDASIFFCKDGSKVCQFDNVRLKIPVEVSAKGSNKVPITIDAVAKGSKEDL